MCAEAHTGTRRRLEAHGIPTVTVPAAELAKAEGGVTCCSIVLPTASPECRKTRAASFSSSRA
jgi:hypothetical protein